MEFHNPYHFVPVDTRQTTLHEWRTQTDLAQAENRFIRHDYWDAEGESGRIECKFRCLSPLIVGAEQSPGSEECARNLEPYHYRDGLIAVPANSLRGMIGSIVEIISQSSLRVLTDEARCRYSVRKPARQDMKLGLLYQLGDEYRIYPLGDVIKVGEYEREDPKVGGYKQKGPKAKGDKQKDPNNQFLNRENCFQLYDNPRYVYLGGKSGSELSDQADAGKIKGVLYIRATSDLHANDMPTKRSESFLPWPEEIEEEMARGVGIKLAPGLIETTEEILRTRQKADPSWRQFPRGYQRASDTQPLIKAGDLIYYREGRPGQVEELSYSAIWRKPVGGSLHQALSRTGGESSLPWHAGRSGLTPAEALLGVVEDEPAADSAARNLASRLRFYDAQCTEPLYLDELETAFLRILDGPKPPSPAMYFRSNKGYIPKIELSMLKHRPNGRKYYLPHRERDIATPPWVSGRMKKEIKNLTQYTECRLVPAGSEFRFHIDYENLSRAELGLLLKALAPAAGEASARFVHRLGTGKPVGLGQIELQVERVQRVARSERYRNPKLDTPRYQSVDVASLQDASLIDAYALSILQTLADPQYLQARVSYPFSDAEKTDKHTEEQGFTWFVENEKSGMQPAGRAQYLEPVQAKKPLPVLDSRHR